MLLLQAKTHCIWLMCASQQIYINMYVYFFLRYNHVVFFKCSGACLKFHMIYVAVFSMCSV